MASPSTKLSTHSSPDSPAGDGIVAFEGLDERLMQELTTFELFFKTFGFKRVHGRLWGFLVLAGQPLSSREIIEHLHLSAGATSTTLNELADWGALTAEFDSSRRCNLHSPVGNTLSIVATVFRRREQVVFGKFKQTAKKTLAYIQERYGSKDSRVLVLRSIISTCEIAEAMMTLIFSSVERALGDSESILTKAVGAALKVGVALPARMFSEAIMRSATSQAEGVQDLEAESAEALLERFDEDEHENEPTNGDQAPRAEDDTLER